MKKEVIVGSLRHILNFVEAFRIVKVVKQESEVIYQAYRTGGVRPTIFFRPERGEEFFEASESMQEFEDFVLLKVPRWFKEVQ